MAYARQLGVLVIVLAACGDEAAGPGLVQPDASMQLDIHGSTTTVVDPDTSTPDTIEPETVEDTVVVAPDIAPGENGATCDSGADCTSGTCANGHCCTLGDGDTACCAIDDDCKEFEGFDGRGVCTGVGPEGCTGNREVGRCNARNVCEVVIIDEPSACAGTPCSDGRCGAGGATVAGLCDFEGRCSVPEPVPCSDGNPCTTDTCKVQGNTVGCVSSPITGIAAEGCYDDAPDTIGEGECREGTILCSQGQQVGCFEAQGPEVERCDGRDEDCDGITDDGTEGDCYPYTCRGFFGCGVICFGDGDCAAGNFCQNARCVSTGEDGAPCEKNGECATNHCSNGFCCVSGICCHDTDDCSALDATSCDEPESCEGTRTTGVCSGDFICDTVGERDDSACEGTVCTEASCDGDVSLPPAFCDGAGLCQARDGQACAPYACDDGACLESCDGGGDCSALAECDDGVCGGLPDGEPCGQDDHCASDHCDNGFCCGDGACCGQTSDCAMLDEEPVCNNDASCGGSQRVGTCREDHRCQVVEVASASACEGRRCGPSECINLTGAQFVLEGLRERLCNTSGQCAISDSDCRDDGDGCVTQSGVFPYEGCSPSHVACIDFSGQRCFE